MHHDIQSFSNVTDIETVNALTIELAYQVHGHCLAIVSINDLYYIEPYCHPATIKVNLFDPINLRVNLVDFKEGSSGIEITRFNINGLEVLPKYQHLATKRTNYIDFYGEWNLEIPAPFYTWYHQISGQGWIA